MNAFAISANPVVQALARSLVHFLWQGALVGLLAGGVLALLAKAKATARYATALGALLLMAALPLATAAWLADSAAPAAAVAPAARTPSSPLPDSGEGVPAPAVSLASLPAALPWVLGVWLAGVAALTLYHLGGWRLARRLPRQGLGGFLG